MAHARTRFREVGRRRIEAFAGASVGLASGVAILQNGVGPEMKIGRRRGTEGVGFVAQELDRLRPRRPPGSPANRRPRSRRHRTWPPRSSAPPCGTVSGAEKRRTIRASDWSSHPGCRGRRRRESRRPAFPSPYPKSPANPSVPVWKIDCSTLKAVPRSEALP